MRSITLYFQIHQPFRLRRYRFFDIGNDSYYYDDYLNESIVRKVADKSYLPTNRIIKELIEKHGDAFKVAFSISGIALEQFKLYAPEVLASFQELAQYPNVEFLAETYAHSLASLGDREEFIRQVKAHEKAMLTHFNRKPTVFRNTELIYSDDIGAMVSEMGYRGMITEGAKHILGWKSPNFLYCNTIKPKLKILLKNFKLSDDIAFRFSNRDWAEWPLTTEKFSGWLNNMPSNEEVVGLFMDYETFGEHQWVDTGIFEFLKALPETIINHTDFRFNTPSEVMEQFQPVAEMSVPYPISWADEERDLTAWLGNELQDEAFHKLYNLAEKMKKVEDPAVKKDWQFLQTSDHFYYMCTKFFSDGQVHSYFNPFESPYDAFINYMNVLSDFEIRVRRSLPEKTRNQDLLKMEKLLQEKEKQISIYEKKLKRHAANAGTKNPSIKRTTSKAPAKAVKKTKPKTTAAKKSSGTK